MLLFFVRGCSGILSQWIVPAFEHARPCGFLDAADMAIQPKCVETAPSLPIIAPSDRMPKNAAVPIHATRACAIMGQIDTCWAGEKHVRPLISIAMLHSGFHVIVRHDDFSAAGYACDLLFAQPAIGRER